MRHFFCVIRIGEPALRGCGTPTLIGSHAQNRPRRHRAARAIVDRSSQLGSDHFADQKRTTIVVPSSAGCERSRSATKSYEPEKSVDVGRYWGRSASVTL